MKKHLFLVAALLLTCSFSLSTAFGQSPEKMSYQAVVRDAANKLVINQAIGMQISILQSSASGTQVYVETHTPTSNANGLVSVEIGTGTVVSGDFASIDWANGPYFIKTETDPEGGTNYTITGITQLVSVPYALHAKTAETVTSETDPLFVASPANEITSGDITNWNNKLEVEQDSSVTNEIQALSISNDTVFLSNGGFVILPAGFDGQYSSLSGKPTNVSSFANDAGYLTSEKDSSVINEIQALSISNDTVFLSNGGFVKLPAGFDGQYSSLSGKPTNVSSFANDAGYLTSEKDSSVINEIQALSISNDTVYLSNGGFVKLPAGFDGQYSSLSGKPTNVSSFANDAGYLTSEKDSSVTNEIQALSISNDTVYLSNGGFVKLPSGFDGQYSSLSGKPTNVSSFANDAGYLTSEKDSSVINEIQALNISNDTVYLSNGGFVKLPAGFDGQYSSLSGKPINVSSFANDAGYLTSEKDSSVTNEIQVLSISNDTVYLSNGGYVKLPDLVRNATIVNDSLYMSFSHGQLINIGYVGNGSPGSSLPTVTTTGVSDTNYYSAKVNATITDNGNELILVRGICLSKNPDPDLKDTLYINGSGQGSFITNCNELSPNTTYYVRAFASNTIGTSYGNNLSFVTKTLTLPTVRTDSVSNITNTTAISGGNISENGGLPILQRGICWALHATPTIADSVRTQGTDNGSYVALMTGLTGGTTYYVRAFATNAQGTAYGNELSFSTVIYSLASIVTSSASNISFTTATGGGTISNDNGSPVTSRGLCWATTTNPTTADSKYTEAGALGSFTATISGLTPNTTYYLRAFAVNGGGTSYGNQISFTTLPTSAPVLTTKSITGISSNNAGSGGNITSDGGSAITAKGVCWSLNPTPTIANSKTTDGTGNASYNSNIIGLNALTTYYVRAYATNTTGTSYGNEVSFTTTNLVSGTPTAPIVGTSTAAMLTGSYASSGGYISSDGGSPIIVRGLCWGTTANPTLANAFSTDSTTATGYFTDTITGLSGCGTIYYIRAYATNSIGTGYGGNQVSVTTGGFRALTTDSVTNVSYYTAVSGGNIIDSGGCPVTARGVCWSYSANPTTGNWHTTDGTGAGTFVSTLTGLFANQTYYVRAYVTTSTGTTYGPERVFTTATPATPYIGQNYAGGIIFYLDSSGQHGLVCAPSDQGLAAWGCNGTLVGANGSAIGTGAANTAAIVASCNTNGAAAYRCDTLTLNGYNNWFLPSINELSLMYSNLHIRGLGGFSTNYPYYYYWSSTERDPNNAYDGYFPNGTFYNADTKTWNINVRAVRAF